MFVLLKHRFGDRRKAMMEDIAILTVVLSSPRSGIKLENVELDMLGQAKTAKLTRKNYYC